MASGRPALPVLPQFLQTSTRRPFPARGQAGPCTRSAWSKSPRQTLFPGPLGRLCPQQASFRRPCHGPGALPRPALTQERSVNASCRSSCTPVLQRLPPPPASVSPSVRGVERTAPGPPLPVSNAPRSKFEFHRFPPLALILRPHRPGESSVQLGPYFLRGPSHLASRGILCPPVTAQRPYCSSYSFPRSWIP